MPSYCTPCDRTFGTARALKEHLAHSRSPHPRCGDCRRAFGSQKSLDSHVGSSVHQERVRTKSVVSKKGPSSPPVTQQQPKTVQFASLILGLGSVGSWLERESRWSIISNSQQQAALDALAMHCHTPEELLKNRYILDANAKGTRKCKACGGLERKIQKKSQNRGCTFHPGARLVAPRGTKPGAFSCCLTTSRGCVVALLHDYRDTRDTAKYTTFKHTPASFISKPKFKAVVLDCEMAGVAGGVSEVISICAVDYFTGAVLLNKLVCPAGKVTNWRSSIHGITKATMLAAVRSGETFAGWNSARQEVWKLIDDGTILVGHALQHDLDALRIIHNRVVDSAILAQNAVGSARQWGLHVLCTQLLHKKIRENSRGLHDCLEDVLATREVALLCTRDKERLRNWAEVAKADEERKVNERKVNKRRATRLRKQAARETVEDEDSADIDLYLDYSSEIEIMHWSDVAEDFGWPHPDTGYDPWSD